MTGGANIAAVHQHCRAARPSQRVQKVASFKGTSMAEKKPVYYPERLCHLAPLRPAKAPIEGCKCKVCEFFRG